MQIIESQFQKYQFCTEITRSHPVTDSAMNVSKFAKESRRADISRIRQVTSNVDLSRATVGKDQTTVINRFALQIPMLGFWHLSI